MNVTSISVSFSATVPTQPYGGIKIDVSWSGDLTPDETPESATQELFQRIRAEVVAAVTPIAKAKLQGVEEALSALPPKEREAMRAKLGPLEWLSVVSPESAFAAPPAAVSGRAAHHAHLRCVRAHDPAHRAPHRGGELRTPDDRTHQNDHA